MRVPIIVLLTVLPFCGCGRKNPVTEISLTQSGVELTDSVVALTSEDWPSWRGPTGDGIAVDQELVRQWDDSANVLWRSDVPGRGHSSPIVVGPSVYLATALRDQQQQMVMAFDRATGNERWRKVVHEGGFPSQGELHQKSTHANGTVVSDGNLLLTAFLNSDSIQATALDFDGEIVWQKEIGKFVSKWGYAPSPVLYQSLVIFAADNQGGGYLAALDAKTGSIAWRISRGNSSSYSSPAIATVGGREQLLISGGGSVTSYDPASGERLWSTSAIAEATCGTIVTSGDRIFASGGYPGRETVCLSAKGERVWANKTRVYEPSMIVVGDKLVAVNDDGIAYAWSIETGDQIIKKRLGGSFSASPILSGDHLYVSNLSGMTYVFKVDDGIEIVAKNRLGDDCYASPAAGGGELFLRVGIGKGRDRREQLVCLGSPAADDSPGAEETETAP